MLRADSPTKKRNTRIGGGANAETASETRKDVLTIVSWARRRTCFPAIHRTIVARSSASPRPDIARDGRVSLSTTGAQYIADKARDVLQGGRWASGYVSACVAAGKARAAVRGRS